MKRILTILLTFLTISLFGQDIKPISPNFKPLQSPSFSYYLNDSSVWIYKGATYGWTKLLGANKIQYKIDSLASKIGTGGTGYYKIFPVTSSTISETYTTAFSDTLYNLNINTWYYKIISGKTIKIKNAIYDFRKFVNGFSMNVDTVDGFVEYSIGGGGGSGGGIEEAPIDGNKYARKDASWVQITNGSGGSTSSIFNETPSGLVNGVNTIFGISQPFAENTERLYLNGIRQIKTTDYSILNQTITMNTAPAVNDLVTVDYDISIILNQIYNEVPSGLINGSNLTFTLVNNVVNSQISLFLNGIRQIYGVDYTVSGNIITMLVAPIVNDLLLVDYKIE